MFGHMIGTIVNLSGNLVWCSVIKKYKSRVVVVWLFHVIIFGSWDKIYFQFQPDVQAAEPLSVDVSPDAAVAVEKPTSPKSKAVRQLHTAAFEPLVEQTQDSVVQPKAETQEAKMTKLASKATKVSVRQGKVFGVSFCKECVCSVPNTFLLRKMAGQI